MGQDSFNLMYGKSHPARVRPGTEVTVHKDEGYPGPYKNSKVKVIGKRSNTSVIPPQGRKTATQMFMTPQADPKRRK